MATMQEKIVQFVPELNSKHTVYPMTHNAWLAPNGKAPDGAPGFVAGSNAGFKKDYVYGPGLNGLGYYHVLTKHAHVAIYTKFTNEAPPMCCSSRHSKSMSDWDDVRLVLHARTRAGRPNDAAAHKSQMDEAMGLATAIGEVYFHNPKGREEWNKNKGKNYPLSSEGVIEC